MTFTTVFLCWLGLLDDGLSNYWLEEAYQEARGHSGPSENGIPSILPFSSDKKIQDLLGKECTENFLFMTLEWQNPVEEESPEGGDEDNSIVTFP
jgi:hypothetical protein